MTTHASSAGWIAECPGCHWRTVSQTKPVVEQRLAAHEATCPAAKGAK